MSTAGAQEPRVEYSHKQLATAVGLESVLSSQTKVRELSPKAHLNGLEPQAQTSIYPTFSQKV